jgi:outer membrane protein assembly factor BamB
MQQAQWKVGRYEILGEVGRGGMAIVYLAREAGLERLVALKELAVFLQASDPASAKRFLREAHVAGSLSHPSIVTVHEYFEEEGVPYLSMEYLENGSLRGYLGSLGVGQIVGALEGVLAGLAHAESRGIVHRDLKPENLMVTGEGGIKIADFGIAKAYDQSASPEFKTATGLISGTPAYMAPEQAMAADVGPWTDLYSLGVVAYEMFGGRVPFDATSDAPMRVLLRHLQDPVPPLLDLRPDLDPALAGWVERLLEKEPEKRPQSAHEAWHDLEEIALSILGPRWRREARLYATDATRTTPKPLTPAAFGDGSRRVGASAAARAAALQSGALVPGTAAEPAVGPTGLGGRLRAAPRWALVLLPLLLIGAVAAVVGLLVLGGGESAPVTVQWKLETGGVESSSPFAGDGRAILGSQNGSVYALNAASGAELWRADTGRILFSSPTVADGAVFVGSEDHNLYALQLGSGEERWRFETGGPVYSSPTVVDGIVYVGSDDRNVYAIDATTGEERWRFETQGAIQSSPAVVDGTVYVGGRDAFMYALHAGTGEEHWRAETAAEIWSSPAVANGIVYVGSSDGNLYAFDAATGEERWRFATGRPVSSSPLVDGDTVYVGSFDHHLYAVDAASGRERWRFRTGDVIYSSPAIEDGVIYVGSHDHMVYALDAQSGALLWSFEAGALVGSSPFVLDGIVYVGSDDGFYYALRSRVGTSAS